MTMRLWVRNLFTRTATLAFRKAPRRARPAVEMLEDRCCPSTFTVTNTLDDGSTGSLRWAVGQANATQGADTIKFDGTVFGTPQTITLGSGGALYLTDGTGTTTITGPAAGLTVSAGGGPYRVFRVNDRVPVSLSGMTITGGNYAGGGGLYSTGVLTMTNCAVSGNLSYSNTGGLGNGSGGTLTMTGCTISGNVITSPYGRGGGLYNSGTATLTNCTVSGNTGGLAGGGLLNNGTLTMTNCTVAGNSLTNSSFAPGGGVENDGTLTMTNCTVSGNSALTGGGLNNTGTVRLGNTIVAGNTAPTSPDVASGYFVGATKVAGGSGYTYSAFPTVTFSGGGGTGAAGHVSISSDGSVVRIFVDNPGSGYTSAPTLTISGGAGSGAKFTANISRVISLGNNLIGKTDGSCTLWAASDLTGTSAHPLDPLLGPLSYSGGPTQTMDLSFASPAFDAGNNALIPAGITTDQRGAPRVLGAKVDIGASEILFFNVTVAVAASQTIPVGVAPGTHAVSFTLSAPLPAGLHISLAPQPTNAIIISGTTHVTTSVTITVTVTDSAGGKSTITFTLRASPPLPPHHDIPPPVINLVFSHAGHHQ